MTEENCRIDGRPMVRVDESHMKCLNEQEVHYYCWPDKFVNSGWLLVSDKTLSDILGIKGKRD